MPLLEDVTPKNFLQVDTIHIDSNRDMQDGGTSARFRIPLKQLYHNVVAIELEEYNVPLETLSAFRGTKYVDFRLRHANINGGNWKTLSAEVSQLANIYDSLDINAQTFLDALYNAFFLAIAKDSDFAGRADIVPVADVNNYSRLVCRTLVNGPAADWISTNATECEFLFGSGVHAGTDSVASILGFDDSDLTATDYNFSGTTYKSVISASPVNLALQEYFDVTLEETPEHQPFNRIFMEDWQASAETLRRDFNYHVRILNKPIRKLQSLTFVLTTGVSQTPVNISDSFYFTVKIFYLADDLDLANYAMSHNRLMLM